MDVLLHNKPRKINLAVDVNADANVDISKWSWKTTVSYLGTKIQVQKINPLSAKLTKWPNTLK